ncbi:hypothetical protein AYI70_g7650, partial [Smittium culicis]
MAVKGIIIPIATYGCELFGMSAVRCYSLQKVADDATRIMAVKGVIIPIATYGCELFGMSAVRCYSLQKVADDATRIAMNVGKSTAMNRLRTELSIAQINTKSSIARERAYHKWSSSRTWISDLINNPMLNRKDTWVTG